MAAVTRRPSLADIFGGSDAVTPQRPSLGDIFGVDDDIGDSNDPMAIARRLRREREREMLAMGALPNDGITTSTGARPVRPSDYVDRLGTAVLSNVSGPVDLVGMVGDLASNTPIGAPLRGIANVAGRGLAAAEDITGLPFTSDSQQLHRQRFRELDKPFNADVAARLQQAGIPVSQEEGEAGADTALELTGAVLDPLATGLGAIKAVRGIGAGVKAGERMTETLGAAAAAERRAVSRAAMPNKQLNDELWTLVRSGADKADPRVIELQAAIRERIAAYEATMPTTPVAPKSPVMPTHDPGTLPIEPPAAMLPPSPPISPSLPNDPTAPIEERLFTALRGAVALRGQQEAVISAERTARLARAADVGKPGGLQGYHAELGAHRGAMTKVEFPSIQSTFTADEIDGIFTSLRDNPALRGYDSLSARTGLLKALNGELPTRGEIALLKLAYGPEYGSTIEVAIPFARRARELGADVIGVPRSLMATLDLSFPLRQGLVAGSRFPKQWGEAFVSMHKYAASEDAFRALAAEIQTRPNYELMRRSGLALTAETLEAANAEEQFVSTLAERLPGIGKAVRASDRAYTGMANKLRADVFDHLITTAERAGREPVNDIKLTTDIARFVNTATGRGDMGALAAASNTLSTTLFSPRLIASRVNMLSPMYYASLDPFVRKEALKSAMSTAAFVTTIGGVAAVAGAKVGLDPRSADFGKAKFGNTRVDLAGGFLQYIRLGAQLATGEVTSSTTGKTTELGERFGVPTRLDLLWRFAQSKASPVVGVVLDMLRGKDMLGRELTVGNEIVTHTTPLILQDFYELLHDDPTLLPLTALGAYGASVQTYQPEERTKFGMTPWGVAPDDTTVTALDVEAERLGRQPDFVQKRVSDPVAGPGVKVTLTPDEYQAYIREAGDMSRQQLTAILADPQYLSAGTRYQRDAWDHILSASRQYAKMSVLLRRSQQH